MTTYTTRTALSSANSTLVNDNIGNEISPGDIRNSILNAFDSAASGTQVGTVYASTQTGFTPPAALGGKWRVVKDVDFQNGLTMTSQDYVIFANCQISGASTFTTCDNVHFFECFIEASLTLSACENCIFINCEEDQAGRITTTSVMNDGIESTTASSTASDQVKTSTTPLLVAHAPFASDRGTVGYAENKISAGQWAEPWGRIYHSQRYDGDPHYGTWLLPWLTQKAGEPYITVEPGVELHLRYVCILNSRGPGIYVKAGGRLILDHCYISHCQGTGIHCEDGSNVLIMRSVIDNNGVSSTHSQIRGAGKQSAYRNTWNQTVVVQSIILNGWNGELLLTGAGTSHRCLMQSMRVSETGGWSFIRPSLMSNIWLRWADLSENTDVKNNSGLYFDSHRDDPLDYLGNRPVGFFRDIDHFHPYPQQDNLSLGAYDYSAGDTYQNTLADIGWLYQRFGENGSVSALGVNSPSHYAAYKSLFPQGYGWIFPGEEAWESDLLQDYPLTIDTWSTSGTTLTRTNTGSRWLVKDREFNYSLSDATTDPTEHWGGSNVEFRNCKFQDKNNFHNFTDTTFVGCTFDSIVKFFGCSDLQFNNNRGTAGIVADLTNTKINVQSTPRRSSVDTNLIWSLKPEEMSPADIDRVNNNNWLSGSVLNESANKNVLAHIDENGKQHVITDAGVVLNGYDFNSHPVFKDGYMECRVSPNTTEGVNYDGHTIVSPSGVTFAENIAVGDTGQWGHYQGSTGRIHFKWLVEYTVEAELWIPSAFHNFWLEQPSVDSSNPFITHMLWMFTSRSTSYPDNHAGSGFLASPIYLEIVRSSSVNYLRTRLDCFSDRNGGSPVDPGQAEVLQAHTLTSSDYDRWIGVKLVFTLDADSSDGSDGECEFYIDDVQVGTTFGGDGTKLLGNCQVPRSAIGAVDADHDDFTHCFRIGLYAVKHLPSNDGNAGNINNPESLHDIFVRYRNIRITSA